METGQERPVKKRTLTAISRGQRSRTGRKIQGRSGPGLESVGLQKEQAAAATRGKGNMNKSDEGLRGDMKSKSDQEGGEGTDWQGKKKNEGGCGAKDWKTGAQLGLRGRNARTHAADSGQAQGARTGTSGAQERSEVRDKWTQMGARRT